MSAAGECSVRELVVAYANEADRITDLLAAIEHHAFQLDELASYDPDGGRTDMHMLARDEIIKLTQQVSRELTAGLEALRERLANAEEGA